MEALTLDVKNYDAFRELIEGGMMSGMEGRFNVVLSLWILASFLSSIADSSQSGNSFVV